MSNTGNTVKITIDVVDANSGAVIGKTTANLEELGVAGAAAGEAMAVGVKKGASGFQMAGTAGANMGKTISRHTTTSLDNVRLLGQELGIRLPRAMENAISRSQALSGVISAMGPALLALGYVGVFAQLAEQAYGFFKAIRDGDSDIKKFDRSLSAAAQKRYFDGAQFSQSRNQFAASDADLTSLDQKAKASINWQTRAALIAEGVASPLAGGLGAVQAIRAPHMTDEETERRNTAREIANTEPLKREDERHRAVMSHLDAEGVKAGSMRAGGAKDQAEFNVARRKADEDHLNRINQQNAQLAISNGTRKPGDKGYLPQVDPNAPDPERDQVLLEARANLSAKNVEFARQESDEVRRLRIEGDNASLRGTRLLEAQRQQAYEDFTIKYGASVAARTAIDRKYAEEKRKLLEDEHAETQRVLADAAAGGLTGLAQIDARTQARMAGIAKEAPGFSDPATRGQRETAARQESLAEQQKLQEAFTDRIRDMDAERANSTMSESQRIDAQTVRTTTEITKAWDELYGKLAAGDQRRVQSYAALQGELRRIDAAGTAEKLQVRRGLEDETLRMEAEAGRRGMTREQQEAQAVLDEYGERYRHLEELRGKDAANADLYRRQEIAAEQTKNGKLLDLERQRRDQLAGILRGYMSNPLEALRRQGEEAASKFGADLLLKATGRTQGATQLGGENKLGSIFGMPGGIFHGSVKAPGTAGMTTVPGRPGGKPGEVLPPVIATSSTVSAASTTLTAATAVIHVGAATFTGMANGGAGAALPAAAAISAAGGGAGGLLGGAGMLGAGSIGVAGLNLSSSLTGSSASVGFSPSGGAGIAGTRTAMGMGDAGAAPSLGLVGGMMDLRDQAGQVNELGKMLGAGDLGQKGTAAMSRFGVSSSTLGKLGGAADAGMGLFSAVESNGGLGGGLQGALSGAKLGGMLGGPMGAAIGAAAGAIVGFIGIGGAQKAREYERKEVKPRLKNDLEQFGQGSMDYQSAWDDLVKLDQEAKFATQKFGPGGKREWNSTIHPEIMAAQQTLTREQKAGRSQYGMTAAQFHSGGLIGDFGSLGTFGDQGFIHAQRDEFMVQQQAVPSHFQALQLINSGGSHSELADYYGAGSRGGYQPASSGAPVTLNFHSHDARGAYELFMDNKHHIREALNQSYAENSGGADA